MVSIMTSVNNTVPLIF